MTEPNQVISTSELAEMLETLIRRVVREELARAFEEQGVSYLPSDSPLYADLLEIAQEEANGSAQHYSYKDIFGE